jgi:hypothetical protein
MGRRRGVCSPSSGEASIMDVDRLRKGCERVWKWLKIGRKRFCPTKEERQMEVWMKEGQKGDAYLYQEGDLKSHACQLTDPHTDAYTRPCSVL